MSVKSSAFCSSTADEREIKKQMRQTESIYLIPQMFLQTEELPVTENGKIDRKKLMADYREIRGKRHGQKFS